jgi:predicted transcriptional regulator of viral defense system
VAYRDTLQARRDLYALAAGQGGYFTAKQARAAGYGYAHLAYHAGAGTFERPGPGLYRLADVPPSEHDDLVRLALWSRDRADVPQAVASHDTALALHGLGELLPVRTHLTVPPAFRKAVPAGVVLHRSAVGPADVEEREGFSVTTPLRTLLDVAAAGTVPAEQVAKAAADAVARGLVRTPRLAAAAAATGTAARLGLVAAQSV